MSTLSVQEAYELAQKVHREGNWGLAEDLYRKILQAEPGHARALHLLGVLAIQRGQVAEGAELIRRAIELDGRRSPFFSNLGVALRQLGRLAESEAALRRSLELEPGTPGPLANLGLTLCSLDRADEAVPLFQEALRKAPADLTAIQGLAFALAELGLIEQSLEADALALKIAPSAELRVRSLTRLPLVYRSTEDLLAWRQRLATGLHALRAEGVRLDVDAQAALPLFALAHQGLDDRPLLEQYVCLFHVPESVTASPQAPIRADGRIRVGFISNYFSTHTVGKLMRGLIAGLSRQEFRVLVLSTRQAQDPVAQFIRQHADECVELPAQLATARQAIADLRLDVLFYCELGMDPFVYKLAMTRLAPVQCVTWGHPSTTGMPSIDYFVSSDHLEPPEAQDHYSERLVRLDSLTFHHDRPQPPEPLQPRSVFGLDGPGHWYACPQSIYKFHPEFDPLLGEILRHDPQGRLVLIRWAYPQADELLRQRFARVMPDVADRIVFIPRLRQPEFLNLLAVVDVLLDPIHFCGGYTSLEGLSVGTPIVTLPSRFLRGRLTAGMYRRIGVTDCIADSPQRYVELAVRLGTDADHRADVRRRILANCDKLFEDPQSLRAMETFLREAVVQARNKQTPSPSGRGPG